MAQLALKCNEMTPQLLYWETQKGIEFLDRVGLKKEYAVLDFGCRVGHYTIPAAKTVGSKGIVYAIDIQGDALAELEQKKQTHRLKNITIIKTMGQFVLPLEDKSIEIVLLYDILHYLKKDDRKLLYNEVSRILKQDGLLSVYPKHCLEDNPIMELRMISIEKIKNEIEGSQFAFADKHCDLISHDDELNYGCVFNFTKQI